MAYLTDGRDDDVRECKPACPRFDPAFPRLRIAGNEGRNASETNCDESRCTIEGGMLVLTLWR